MKTYERLSYEERVEIGIHLRMGFSIGWIAETLGRNKSTVSREIRRCELRYFAPEAQVLASVKYRRNQRKLDKIPRLREFVFSGLRKRWSPDQISHILKREFPKDHEMRISPESIYTYIYVLPRGELRKELILLLRQKKGFRYKRDKLRPSRGKDLEMISITERPSHVADRSLAGDWEGDLIIGKNQKSAIGTLVERKTRAVIIVPIKSKKPASVRKAFEKAVKNLPQQMKQSLTYDRGFEMAEHRLFTANTKMKVYFCHPSSPWERGTCENTNGLIRDYFPKGTDFSLVSKKELKRVQDELNERPRKTLDYRTPKEVINKEILQAVALEA